MQSLAKSKGGRCISEKYTNAHTELLWECEEGHRWPAKPNKIQQGTWCKICGVKKVANSNRGNIQDAKKLAESKGGLCLSEIYENAREPLIWQCENGHEWPASYDSVKGSSSRLEKNLNLC